MAARQDQVPGFETTALAKSSILVVGGGGIGGEIASGLARKGVGRLVICDNDVVEISNLNRQRFYPADMYQLKALRLAKNVANEGCLGTDCIGHAVAFDGETAAALSESVDVVVVGVDNNRARAVASRYFRNRRIPVVFTAVNEASNFGWVFVQGCDGPCLGCIFPFMAESLSRREPCRDSPAVIDILRVVSGAVLYAVDSLLMPRARRWNFRDFNLIGDAPDCVDWAEVLPNCPLCCETQSDE